MLYRKVSGYMCTIFETAALYILRKHYLSYCYAYRSRYSDIDLYVCPVYHVDYYFIDYHQQSTDPCTSLYCTIAKRSRRQYSYIVIVVVLQYTCQSFIYLAEAPLPTK